MAQQLPNELKIQIIRHVDRESLPSVLRVNSTFHEIGVPILYHTIIVSPHHTTQATGTKLLNTIIERPEAARAVHSMGVYLFIYLRFESDIGAKQFFKAFRKALPKLVNLQKLEISDLGTMGRSYIAQFPYGSRLSALKHYAGPLDTLHYIQSSVLRTLYIDDGQRSIYAISSALLTAARLSGQTLRALRVRCGDSESEWESLYKDIPSLFPNLRSLNLEPWHDVSFAVLDKVIPNIALLSDLRLLRLSSLGGIALQEEESKVKHLHAGCPQLRAIVLRHGDEPWRYSERARTWLQQPKNEHGSDNQLWQEADYRKYIEDADHEGFAYSSLFYISRGG